MPTALRLLSLCSAFLLLAGEPAAQETAPLHYSEVDFRAEPADGFEKLEGRTRYPELARRAGIQGTVQTEFFVDERGFVADPVCVNDPGGQTCEEALRALRDTYFRLAEVEGKPVAAQECYEFHFDHAAQAVSVMPCP
jgi:protein TonB